MNPSTDGSTADGSAKLMAVEPSDCLLLRQRVLRPSMSLADCAYPGDTSPESFHLAAVDTAGHPASIASFHPEPLEDKGERVDAWRIRAVATAPERRGEGLSAAVLRAGMTRIESIAPGSPIWCVARLGAAGFYERLGFQPFGESFVHPEFGPQRPYRRGPWRG